MAQRRPRVWLDITAHKEELNVTQVAKKTKVRARYYVELVMEDPMTRTRMGFNGTFRQLLAFHEEFIKYAAEIRKEESWMVHSHHSSSSRHSLAAMPSSCSSSSTLSFADPDDNQSEVKGVKKLFRKLGLSKPKQFNGANADQDVTTAPNSSSSANALGRQHSRSNVDQHSVHQLQQQQQEEEDERKRLLHDFPDFHKRHFLLKLEQHGEDKMESRSQALFEYYTRLFNSEFCELLIEFFVTRAKASCERQRQLQEQKEREQQLSGGAPPSADGPGWRAKLSAKLSSSSVSPEDAIEFVAPVVTRLHRKSAKKH